MGAILKKTPLYDVHIALGANMINFHGFLMPIQYDSIINEHKNVRNKAGIFDVSHMGEIVIEGKGAGKLVQWIVANDIDPLPDHGILYTPLCSNVGGIYDDALVYKYNSEKYMFVVNCSNIKKDFRWIKKFETYDTDIKDLSGQLALLAVQGPNSEKIIQKVFGKKCAALSRFQFKEITRKKMRLTVSRTGYTGEDGFEIITDKSYCMDLWKILLENGRDEGLRPTGLGARDTLRLEAGLLLYGSDINETTTPFEANIDWTVKLDKWDFVGKDSLSSQKEHGLKKKLIAFKMLDKSIPRAKNGVTGNGHIIGKVTSGTFSPTLGIGIGLGYVDINYTQINSWVEITIRRAKHPAVIVNTPFVPEPKKGP